MYNLLISSPEMLKKVISAEKYDFKKIIGINGFS